MKTSTHSLPRAAGIAAQSSFLAAVAPSFHAQDTALCIAAGVHEEDKQADYCATITAPLATAEPEKVTALQAANALFFLRGFIGTAQAEALRLACYGEEGAHFRALLVDWATKIHAMPATYGQDGLGLKAIAHLHYFRGGSDWYVTEKDAGAADDTLRDFQTQAFGVVKLHGNDPETGYISIRELITNDVELDLYWTAKPLETINQD